MGRPVPYSETDVCDECGRVGAYDFIGDILCEVCADKYLQSEEEIDEEFGTPRPISGDDTQDREAGAREDA